MSTKRYVRPMGIVETVRSVFELYRRHFLKFILVNAVAVIPLLLNEFVTLSSPSIGAAQSLWSLIFFVLLLITSYLGLAVTTVAASNAVLARPVSVSGAYSRVLSPKLIGRFLLCGTEVGIRVEIGLIPFIIATVVGIPVQIGLVLIPFGIILYIRYMYWAPVFVLEKITARPPLLKRSRELARGDFWRLLFVYFILYYIPYLVLSFAVRDLVQTISVEIFVNQGPSLVAMFAYWILTYGYILVFAPIGSLLVTLLYYTQRARKENYNEDLLAQDLEYKPLEEMVTV
jgi:hypothetical protein